MDLQAGVSQAQRAFWGHMLASGQRMRWARPYWLLAVLVLACQRKAPGPDECMRFAYRAAGVQRPEHLRLPEVRDRVDTLTTRCLTTPYDRELLQCVELTGRTRACTLSFEARRAR